MKRRDRIIALIVAIAFFATSFALSFFVIWEIVRGNGESEATQTDDTQQLLAGTKLADFDPVESVDELQTIDLEEGTGKEVKSGDTVTVDYTGALAADGTIFESSLDSGQPVAFPLDGVIEGWTEGIPGMKEGGKRRLIIPADMAYGEQERPGIPANSALVFDVTLLSVGDEQEEQSE